MIKNLLFKKINYAFSKINASINLKPRELHIEENTKCLCLAPHPDDESIGMGGLLSLFPENFEVILLTDGRKGIKGISSEEVIKTREAEFECAMKVAQIEEYSMMGAMDKSLLDELEIANLIDINKYDYIFLPNIIDQHPDHKAVSFLVKKLLNTSKIHQPKLKICFYEVWSTLGMVNSFVDISPVVEKKKAMINCYKSQTEQKDYIYYALGLNQYRGMFKDKKFAEAFCVMNVKEFEKISTLYE